MRTNIADLEPQELVEYRYLKGDILKEAEKRSSYIGKMRRDKENEDFIDRMSLTEGESFLSEEMLADAIEKVYEWVQAFGRGIEKENVNVLTVGTVPAAPEEEDYFISTDDNKLYQYLNGAWVESEIRPFAEYTALDTNTIYIYDGTTFVDVADYILYTLQPRSWWDRKAYSRVERYLKEALINYVLYRWFEFTNLEEVELYYKKYEEYAHEAQLGMNAENGNLERRFNTPFNTIFG